MTKRRRQAARPDDMQPNPHEGGDFLRAFGRKPSPPAAVKPKAAKKPRRIRNPAEARFIAEVWAAEAAAVAAEAAERRARKFNVNKA